MSRAPRSRRERRRTRQARSSETGVHVSRAGPRAALDDDRTSFARCGHLRAAHGLLPFRRETRSPRSAGDSTGRSAPLSRNFPPPPLHRGEVPRRSSSRRGLVCSRIRRARSSSRHFDAVEPSAPLTILPSRIRATLEDQYPSTVSPMGRFMPSSRRWLRRSLAGTERFASRAARRHEESRTERSGHC